MAASPPLRVGLSSNSVSSPSKRILHAKYGGGGSVSQCQLVPVCLFLSRRDNGRIAGGGARRAEPPEQNFFEILAPQRGAGDQRMPPAPRWGADTKKTPVRWFRAARSTTGYCPL